MSPIKQEVVSGMLGCFCKSQKSKGVDSATMYPDAGQNRGE
jgi:hypothetical protein